MNILIVGLVSSYQAKRLKEEAVKRGHTLVGAYSKSLTISASVETFSPSLRGDLLTNFDLIYAVTVEHNRWMWNAAFEYTVSAGKVVVNKNIIDPAFHYNPHVTKEYLELTKAGLPYPKSVAALSHTSTDFIMSQLNFPFILKSGEVHKGKSVFKVENKDQLVEKVNEIESRGETIIAREFIPNDGDIRVITLGGVAIGAMKRTPKEGDFKSNISQGGEGSVFDLGANPEIKSLAESASKALQIDIAGVDIIIDQVTGKPYILEVNTGPQFEGFETYTGVNVAAKIIEYFESLV